MKITKKHSYRLSKLVQQRSSKMVNSQVKASRNVLAISQQEEFPYFIEKCGLKLIVHKDVFSPKHFHGPEIFTRNFPLIKGEEILEIGCGTGVTGLFLAKSGAKKVTLNDISSEAVKNCRKNAQINNITNCEIRESDIFSTIRDEERFDTIYWNMPFIPVPEKYKFNPPLERTLFDPGFKLIKRFLQEASIHLKEDGRLLIGWGNSENHAFGNPEKLKELAQRNQFSIKLLIEQKSTEGNPVTFQLYELGRIDNEQ